MQENGIYRKGLLSVKIETATGTVSRVDGGEGSLLQLQMELQQVRRKEIYVYYTMRGKLLSLQPWKYRDNNIPLV